MIENPRPSLQEVFMDFALKLSERSTCSRMQVGCVITDTSFREVLSIGYNGGADGLENECASMEPGMCLHIHAEENAVIKCRAPRELKKIVFCSHLPCEMCAKRLINLGGVVVVYYKHDYRIRKSLDLLAARGISSMKMD